jgi:hypothetical protein
MRKALALALFALCAAPMFASVELDTSINDVFSRGTNELAGSITWNVTGDDFREASTDEPVFIRVTPDHNSFLAETLVRQSAGDEPINLAMTLDGSPFFTVAADPEAISIVRWVAGEAAFWIRVQQTSDQWLDTGTGLVGPSVDQEVSWTVGISARLSDERNEQGVGGSGSNLPFNTRDETANEGDFDEATSTLICLDLSSSNLADDGSNESLLDYDIIAYDRFADLGGGVFSGQAGNDTGINFTNDFSIARGKSRSCDLTILTDPKDSDSISLLCIYAAASNGTQFELVKLTNDLSIVVGCTGGNTLDTSLVQGARVEFSTGGRGNYGFRETGNVRFTNVAGYSLVDGVFDNNGYDLYRNADLFYNDVEQPLNFPFSAQLDMEICVYTHYTDDPIQAIVDWQLILVSHDGARDELPPSPITGGEYDGDDQFRRCEPSEFAVGDPLELVVGWFVECDGNPVSIFFPYLPILVGQQDFWVGLSYVNQGATDLNIEAIFYDEDGNRFAGSLGDLEQRNLKTWLLIENSEGIATLTGRGGNNDGEEVIPEPDDPNLSSADFGTTRSSLFVRGTFQAEFLDDVFNGDLDGYMLIGNATTLSIDGAYLPRNYDNDIPGQNADLPLWRSKQATKSVDKVSVKITSDRDAKRY